MENPHHHGTFLRKHISPLPSLAVLRWLIILRSIFLLLEYLLWYLFKLFLIIDLQTKECHQELQRKINENSCPTMQNKTQPTPLINSKRRVQEAHQPWPSFSNPSQDTSPRSSETPAMPFPASPHLH